MARDSVRSTCSHLWNVTRRLGSLGRCHTRQKTWSTTTMNCAKDKWRKLHMRINWPLYATKLDSTSLNRGQVTRSSRSTSELRTMLLKFELT